MTKTVITGHTYGIGKVLCEHYNAVGLSRSNGYDIDKDFDRVVEQIQGADLFINNAYRDKQQLRLFDAVKHSVGKIVCMGSISRLYPDLILTDYVNDKQELYKAMQLHSLTPGSCPTLHLDLSFIESTDVNLDDPTNFTSDNHISFREIVNAIDFWLENPKVKNIEFEWKLTPFVYEQLKRANPDHTALDALYASSAAVASGHH